MKAKIQQHKPPAPLKLTEQQRANAKEWHGQKLAESFGELFGAIARCEKILGNTMLTCEAMRIHALELQNYSKDGRKKCKK